MNLLPAFDPLGLPAPLWLLFGLKVFGFWVHMFFMNLWFAGLIVGLVLLRGREPLATAGRRLVAATPVWVALGVNAGIVPLLFLQVLYPQFFYTSTILQAWPWLAIIPLMIVAYYGTYVYVMARKNGRTGRWVGAAGWIAAAIFAGTGFIFATQMQFMTDVGRWADTVAAGVGGTSGGAVLAVHGSAVQRLLMMFGLALATTAAYVAFDATVLQRRADRLPDAARGIAPLVLGLAAGGLAIFGLGGAFYLPAAREGLAGAVVWPGLAAAGPVLVLAGAALFLTRPGRASAIALLLAQLVSLLFNAIARQLVQFGEIAPHFDLGAVPVDFQLSPVVLFAGTLVLGLTAIGWLVAVFVREGGRPIVDARAPAQPARTEPAVPAGGA